MINGIKKTVEYENQKHKSHYADVDKQIEETNKEIKDSQDMLKIKDTKFIQKKDGLYSSADEKHNTDYLIAKIIIKNITIYYDPLSIVDCRISFTYKNNASGLVKTIEKQSLDVISNTLLSESCFYVAKLDFIKHVIHTIIFYGENTIIEDQEFMIESFGESIKGKKLVENETKIFKKGYFFDLKNNEVRCNTELNQIKASSILDIKDEVADAIRMVNDILSTRSCGALQNDCVVLRYMLVSVYFFCLKQIGYNESCYGLILQGKAKANKTGAVRTFSNFYSDYEDGIDATTDTTSGFGSRLSENTLPSCFDESYQLITHGTMNEPMKRCIYDMKVRATKNRYDNQKIDEFIALSCPIFTFNPLPKKLDDAIQRRYFVCKYTTKMIVQENVKKEFNIKYEPRSPNSPLKKLRYLGKAFEMKMIDALVNRDNRLYDLKEFTVQILKEIADEVGVQFNPEVYNNPESYNGLKQDINYEVSQILSGIFKQATHNKHIPLSKFQNLVGENIIGWLYVRGSTSKLDWYVINRTEFRKDVSTRLGQDMEAEEILKCVGIDLNDDEMKKQIEYGKWSVYGNKSTVRGYEIDGRLLRNNVFNIVLYDDYRED